MDNLNKLIGCTDAQVWAREFVKLVKEKPSISTDEGTMIGWFANAIMAGWDKGAQEEKEKSLIDKMYEVIYEVAGAATSVCMRDNPDYVFPSERITEAIRIVLKDHGIPVEEKEQPNAR